MGFKLLVRSSLVFIRGHWYAFLVVFSLLLGLFVAEMLVAQPKVAVVPIHGSILTKSKSDSIVRMVRSAGEMEDVVAVVLDINSPGGEVTVSEDIFLNVRSIRQRKPVVASINQIGASGSYYLALPANLIYAKPSSQVGSVGVVSDVPSTVSTSEGELVSGPFKGPGLMKRTQAVHIETVKDNFVNMVFLYRGDKLSISRQSLAMAGLYLGVEAKQYGLVDEIGSTYDAIDKAARLAGVAHWKTIYLDELMEAEGNVIELRESGNNISSGKPNPTYYYIYREMR